MIIIIITVINSHLLWQVTIDDYKKKAEQAEDELHAEKRKHKAEIKSLENAQYVHEYGEETWKDFFKRKFYDQMVIDPSTKEPRVCQHTGEAISKARKFENQRDEARAELDKLRALMPSAKTNALLRRVQLKARQFKRKYMNAKDYMRATYKVTLDDKFCESDKNFDADSDEDLGGESRPRVVEHDFALPHGFSRMAVEEEDD